SPAGHLAPPPDDGAQRISPDDPDKTLLSRLSLRPADPPAGDRQQLRDAAKSRIRRSRRINTQFQYAMIQKISLILAVATTVLLSSCKKDEPYDHPFIYVIQADDDAYAATSTVSSQATV